MKKYKIIYQSGNDRLVVNIEAESEKEAAYKFYMENSIHDILEISEV